MRCNIRCSGWLVRTFICLAMSASMAACGTEIGGEGDTSVADTGASLDIGFGDFSSFDTGSVAMGAVEADSVEGKVADDSTDGEPGGSCPGGPGCECAQSSDCDNNLCIDVAKGKRCAIKCVDSCEDGFTCAQVGAGGSDMITICVPTNLHLCDPCSDSKACKSLGVDDAVCVDHGSAGAFCGAGCKTVEQCAEGFHCKAVTTIEGASTSQCVPKPGADGGGQGVCTCSQAAMDAKLSTACSVEHFTDDKQLAGKCSGVRVCNETGLGPCTAPPLEVEVCDGKDNDCDGKVDEDTCADENDCTQSVCDPTKGCLVTKFDKVPCDADGDVCTENDACKTGICLPGVPKKCDDGNPCTIAACDLAAGCTQTADDGKPCDADGTACTVGDICADGTCSVGKAISCDDSNACTKDACDNKTGGCTYNPLVDDVSCDDGTACTIADSCIAGACQGKKLVCDDANACTANTCSPKTGCKKTPLDGAACDDDNPCTIGALCKADQCVAGKLKNCDAGDPCVIGKCKLATGKCNWLDKSDGESCDDGSACTASDACKGGNCGGKQINCDDSNVCTSDSCDKVAGCKQEPFSQSCSDGNACTESDACVQGKCVGKAVGSGKCDDGNPCTDDSCLPKTGCANVTNTKVCSDGDSCTYGDQCAGGKCAPGKDKCQCQTDSDCAAKEDGNKCNGTLFCDKSQAPFSCKSDPLTVIFCDNSGDGPCKKTSCVPQTGKCVQQAAANGKGCDADGSVCTQKDACSGGICKAGAALDCNDGKVCTYDLCDKLKGCYTVNSNKPCNDSNACTGGDTCVGGKCAANPINCNDNNVCTEDLCDTSSGCKLVPNASPCNDGNACTKNDKCNGGKCDGDQLSCNDSNPCTTDSCHTSKGCQTSPVVDKTPCGSGKVCLSGKCQSACTPLVTKYHFNDAAQGNGFTFSKCLPGTSYYTPTGCKPVSGKKPQKGWQVDPVAILKKSPNGALYYGDPNSKNFNFGASSGTVMTPKMKVPKGKSQIEFWIYWDTESGTTYDKTAVWVYLDGVKKNIGSIANPSSGSLYFAGVGQYTKSKTWTHIKKDTSAWAGKDLQLLFFFNSGDSIGNSGTGVFVDDIKLTVQCGP